MGGFLGGLSEGFGTAVGQRQDAAEARRQDLINQQRETQVHGFQQAGQMIQQKLATIDPNDQTPEVAQNRADLQAALEHVNQQTTDLFHPSKDPGALQHLGQLISQHVFGHQPTPPVAAQTPATTASTPATAPGAAPLQGDTQAIPTGVGAPTQLNLPASTGPAVAGPNPPPPTADQLRQQVAANLSRVQAIAAAPTPGTTLTPAEQHHAAQVGAGIAARPINYRPLRPTDKPFKMADGSIGYFNVDDPDSIPVGATAVLPASVSGALKPRAAFSKDAQGNIFSVMIGPDNQMVKGSENYNVVPPIGYLPSIRHGQALYTDNDGNVHQIPTTGSSAKDLSGIGNAPAAAGATAAPPVTPSSAPKLTGDSTQLPSAATPRTAGPLRAKAKAATAALSAPASDGVNTGKIIGYKGSQQEKDIAKQVGKANEEATAAGTYLNLVSKSADAAKQGDGPAMVSIIGSYLKGVLGGKGSGVRITKPEWEAAVGTRPWLQGVTAHFTPDGYLQGAVLSPVQIDQIKQELANKQQVMQDQVTNLKRQKDDQVSSDTGGRSKKTSKKDSLGIL